MLTTSLVAYYVVVTGESSSSKVESSIIFYALTFLSFSFWSLIIFCLILAPNAFFILDRIDITKESLKCFVFSTSTSFNTFPFKFGKYCGGNLSWFGPFTNMILPSGSRWNYFPVKAGDRIADLAFCSFYRASTSLSAYFFSILFITLLLFSMKFSKSYSSFNN